MKRLLKTKFGARLTAQLLLLAFALSIVPGTALAAEESEPSGSSAPAEVQTRDAETTAEIYIQNNEITDDRAAWSGTLNEDEEKTIAFTEGQTAQDLLESYAADKGYTLDIRDGAWGAYLNGINGLKADETFAEDYNWTAWMYEVNDTMAPVGMDQYEVKPGDVLTFYFTGEKKAKTAEIYIQNDEITDDRAAWSGTLNEDEVKTIALTDGDTAQDLLERYAADKGYTLDIRDGAWGAYLNGINGLKADETFAEDYNWTAWMYEVNGTMPSDGMGQYEVKPGDVLTFYFTGEKKAKTAEIYIQNDEITDDRAAWSGTLNEDEVKTIVLTDGDTAQDLLERYAADKGYTLGFEDAGWGPYLNEINGLKADETFAEDYDWTAWLYEVNGTMASDGMGQYEVKPGDVLTFYFTGEKKATDLVRVTAVNKSTKDFSWDGDLNSTVDLSTLAGTHTAKDVLEKFAEEQGKNIVFTDEAGTALESFNGLSRGLVLPDGRESCWEVSLNGEATEDALNTLTITGGDSLEIAFTTTGEASHEELPQLDAFWPSFRGSESNTAVRPFAENTPLQAAETALCWSRQFGDPANFKGMPGQPIVVEDKVYIIHGNTLEALSTADGSTLRQVALPGNQSYASTSAYYADGMIFVSLAGESAAAYRADTLELLWSLPAKGKAQPQAPLAYDSEKRILFAGYYNDGVKTALKALDADTGRLLWSDVIEDGYYWAGGVVSGPYFIHGNEKGEVIVRDKASGKITDTYTLSGPVRTSVVKDGGDFYTADNTGNILRFRITEAGKIKDTLLRSIGAPVTANLLPYKESLYAASAGKLVIMNTSDLSVRRTISVPGYVQGSPLLLYGEGGERKIYLTVNAEPGALYIFNDASGDTEDGEVSLLYEPPAEAQNYCIASPILLPGGKILYRNDSGNYFALCRKAETEPGETTETSESPEETTSASEEATDASGSSTSVTEKEETTPASESSGAAKTTKEKAPAKTGEGGSQWLIAVILLAVAVVLIIIVIVLRKKSENGKPQDPDDEEKK